jgi:hypothetical protein
VTHHRVGVDRISAVHIGDGNGRIERLGGGGEQLVESRVGPDLLAILVCCKRLTFWIGFIPLCQVLSLAIQRARPGGKHHGLLV